MKITTYLISGAGNTFHIADENAALGWNLDQKRSFAQAVCKLQMADGFIFIKKNPLAWDFFNNDGSDAEMCGNATRCVGLFLSEIQHDQQNNWVLKTAAGLIQIEKVIQGEYKAKMTPIVEKFSAKGFFCDTGVPHLVIEIENIDDYPQIKGPAQKLRFDPEFPKGTNVTYVQLLSDSGRVKAVSFERGVENFTQACGTGAMAAAVFNFRKRGAIDTQVEMPGGILKMSLADLHQPVMIGPAQLLGIHEYEDTICSKN